MFWQKIYYVIGNAIKNSLIAFPILTLVFIIIGTEKEHGDSNAGLMYGFYAFYAFVVSFVCYLLYHLTDVNTQHSKWNVIKYFGHLIFAVELFWITNRQYFFLISVTLVTLTAINLVIAFVVKIRKA